MNALLDKARTAWALGPLNILRVADYRLGTRHGWNGVRRIQAPASRGPFFAMPAAPVRRLAAPQNWWHAACYFGQAPVALGAAPPDWHGNPLTGQRVREPDRPWWQIADFDPAVGDIKAVWEASRMDWVLAFAQRAAAGDAPALARLNAWLDDWCVRNPPYRGPNWKCGQEASIRVIHLALAALMLGSAGKPLAPLLELVRTHLRRIAPTRRYAMGQDNNHGTSEAAALYIGGSWLHACGQPEGARWARAGRNLLENRVQRLVMGDGSFSQYSVTYHRVALDTLCMAEVWRRHLGDAPFSQQLITRAAAATHWLRAMVQPGGDAPNLGANDGANFLPLTDAGYRDFRPSVQLAGALFCGWSACPEAADSCRWLDVAVPQAAAPPLVSENFANGGYCALRQGDAFALLRYPRFRFRPSQADALHVDLWVAGQNLLRDAGTYGYNVEQRWLDYFAGTEGHNTVQFDGRDQMPRLGRFLFGRWLKTAAQSGPTSDGDAESCMAAYADSWGATHRRVLTLRARQLVVTDAVAGFSQKAVLRWRLRPGNWVVDGHTVRCGSHALSITASAPVQRLALAEGWESRHYLEKTPAPVLEVELRTPGVLTSTYTWE